MRDNDIRSHCVAVVSDSIVNFHAGLGDSDKTTAAGMMDVLERLGFGVLMLPPTDIAQPAAENAIEIVMDQLRDYKRAGYNTVLVGMKTLPDDGIWRGVVGPELVKRGVVMSATVMLEGTEGKGNASALAEIEARLEGVIDDAVPTHLKN